MLYALWSHTETLNTARRPHGNRAVTPGVGAPGAGPGRCPELWNPQEEGQCWAPDGVPVASVGTHQERGTQALHCRLQVSPGWFLPANNDRPYVLQGGHVSSDGEGPGRSL